MFVCVCGNELNPESNWSQSDEGTTAGRFCARWEGCTNYQSVAARAKTKVKEGAIITTCFFTKLTYPRATTQCWSKQRQKRRLLFSEERLAASCNSFDVTCTGNAHDAREGKMHCAVMGWALLLNVTVPHSATARCCPKQLAAFGTGFAMMESRICCLKFSNFL